MRLGVALAAALVAGLVPIAAPPQIACAAEEPRAVLVVDTGPDERSYCVALPDGSVSGTELIALAHEQHGLTYKLGFGGGAVCMLAGVGPTGGDCFEDYPDFWGYWHGDGSGGWTWGSSSAANTTVGDGDVEGWAWGSGDGPNSHPAPPATEFSSVCEPLPAAPKPKPEPKPEREPEASPVPPVSGDDTSAPAARARPGGGDEKKKRPRDRDRTDGDGQAVAPPTPAPAPSQSPSLQAERASSEGPPAAGIAGLLAALVLGGVGVLVTRRRRGPP